MSGRPMVIGLTVSLTAVWLATAAADAQEAAKPIPPGRMRMDEVGTRYAQSESEIVPPAQREALGLDDTRWTRQYGKIHPDVYKMLEKAEKIQARARSRREAYLDPTGLAGTVYVQVQLKHLPNGKPDSVENKAAVKQLESKVLSRLTAAEFFVEYPFQTLPGILGYVNRAGLEKLGKDADVVAVRLDDKPFAQRPKHVLKVNLPPLCADDPATQPAEGRFWNSGGKVEAEVYQALGLRERVFVIVLLRETQGEPQPENVGTAWAAEERVLNAVSAEEFWPSGRTPIGCLGSPVLGGYATMSGLKKLANHSDVEGVGIEDEMLKID